MTYRYPVHRLFLLAAMLCMVSGGAMRAQEAVPVTIQTLKLQTTDRKEISITPPATTAGYSLTLPLTAGANGSVLTSNGEGVLSWVLPSTTGWSLLGNSNIDSTQNFLGTTNGQPLVLKTNGAEAFRIRSTGQVLVTSLNGTATASVPNGFDRIVLASTDGELSEATILSVVGAGIEGNALSLSGNTTTTAWNGTSGTYLGTKSAQPLVLATTNTTAQDIRFYTGANGATERLRIKSTGELVVSDLGGVTPSGPPIPGGYDRVVIANSSGQLDEVSIPALFSATGWALAGNEGLTSGGALGETATGTAKLGTTDGVDLRLITNGLTRMIITSAGAITMGSTLGVTGATTLSSTLGVTGATTIGGTLTLSSVAQGVAADSVLLINGSNQVTRTSRASLFANSGWALAGNNITDASTQFLGTTSSQPLVIRTNNTEKLRITSDGELLIGVATDGGTYVVQTSGNALVGGHIDINTSGQSRRISTRYLSGTSGNNIFIGGGGGNLSTTGDINDASNNVSLGVNALNANTAGRLNVAIGSAALQANTTGMGNIAVGSSALLANTTGYYNTATGLLSLTANTSGLFNTAYGYGTLQANTTASDNVAVGFTAMGSNTTGGSNVAVGGHALSGNTTGASNTAIGGNAGRFLNPGGSLVPNTNSSRSVYVGNDTRASDSTNVNEIVIGARARGSGSNTATIGDSTLVATHLRGHLNLTYPAVAATAPELRLYEATTNGSNYTALRAGAQSADITYTLPTAAPTVAGQVLSAATDGTMSWSTPSSTSWALAGNSITDASTQFLGTTSSQPLVIRTNNTEKFRITSDGNVGIGDASPTALFTVGSGDLFQVNSSGAIAAATGVTTTGNVRVNPTGGVAGQLQLGNPAGTFQTNIQAGAQTANITYTLPTTAPTAGQVLSSATDGTMSWTTVTGLQFFDETLSNAAPNATVNAVRLQPKASTTNVDAVLSPRGTGALLASTPDATATGGNKRGLNAVDLQMVRLSATEVASGNYSTIVGGTYNTASGIAATVGGGGTNAASGNNATVSGGSFNTASGIFASIVGGSQGIASGPYSTILGGYGLTLSGRGSIGFNAANATPNNTMSVSSDGVMVLGNTNLWLANTDNVAREMRFYEAQNATGAFPGVSTNYTALKAGVQASDITYTLPTTAPSAGQVLSSATDGTMSWTTITSGWGLTGNAGTDSTTNYIGTSDETVGRPLIIRTDGTERARFAGVTGYLGAGTTSPNVQVDVNGGFATRPTMVAANAATTNVTVGNSSMVVITSDAGSASRRVTLSNGLQDGQRLVVIILGSGGNATFGVELKTSDANLRLSGDAMLEDGDTIELVYYSGNWFETNRSANDE